MADSGKGNSFDNLPNFRQAGGRGLTTKDGRHVRDGLLYRSSRSDFVTAKDVEEIQRLGIRSILDLRRKKEFVQLSAQGDRLLEDHFEPCTVKGGEVKPFSTETWTEKLYLRKRTNVGGGSESDESTDKKRKRFLVNVMDMNLILHTFRQLNIVVRTLSLVLVLIDFICGSHLFVKFFAWALVNHRELWENYLDILEHAQKPVLDALRVVSNESNLPVLVQCAHGKDRTGVVVALILGCLGVEEEVIVKDYAESDVGLEPIRERVLSETVLRFGFKEEFSRADEVTMRKLLECVKEKYGSIPFYLESIGFTRDEQLALRKIFLKPKSE
jgi:protein tyrosine/serine phosphatase